MRIIVYVEESTPDEFVAMTSNRCPQLGRSTVSAAEAVSRLDAQLILKMDEYTNILLTEEAFELEQSLAG